MTSRKVTLSVVISAAMLCLALLIYVERYPLLYHYYLWRLSRTTCGSEIMDLNEGIRAIGSHIVPLLLITYKDTRQMNKIRNAAASSLIEADKKLAEDLFFQFLRNQNNEIVANAIFNLGSARSTRFYENVIVFVHSPSESIRWAVASYLGELNDKRSLSILQQMTNDKSNKVRNAARYRLKLIKEKEEHGVLRGRP